MAILILQADKDKTSLNYHASLKQIVDIVHTLRHTNRLVVSDAPAILAFVFVHVDVLLRAFLIVFLVATLYEL